MIVGDREGNLMKLSTEHSEINVLQEIKNAHKGSITSIFSYGSRFATSSFDKNVGLWSSNEFEKVTMFSGHCPWVKTVEFNDSYLVSGSSDGTILIYDMRTFAQTKLIRRNMETRFKEISRVRLYKNREVIVSAGNDDRIAVHDLHIGNQYGKTLNPHTMVRL